MNPYEIDILPGMLRTTIEPRKSVRIDSNSVAMFPIGLPAACSL